MKILSILVSICLMQLVFISCNNNSLYKNELRNLELEFGGDWSWRKNDNCILLKVQNSERIDQAPDSLMYFIDLIDEITKNLKVDKCLDFEHVLITRSSNATLMQSSIYIIRPE